MWGHVTQLGDCFGDPFDAALHRVVCLTVFPKAVKSMPFVYSKIASALSMMF
jgi:hypothetical protein